ncbi:uncharacterized protein STAUR_0093 [Stigmatella aurantiaca DW4/3-1]|uniref:Uncharacterized protein n=1 Tax=Stigmatella aurantiaca (strain DW4/3-1) TaxID=378806 RepID=E3FJ02_STIAD|nr:uncharacterized protein STAUR_0093 [Stigmatella aurantiaca DW4/3-1]
MEGLVGRAGGPLGCSMTQSRPVPSGNRTPLMPHRSPPCAERGLLFSLWYGLLDVLKGSIPLQGGSRHHISGSRQWLRYPGIRISPMGGVLSVFMPGSPREIQGQRTSAGSRWDFRSAMKNKETSRWTGPSGQPRARPTGRRTGFWLKSVRGK